MIQISTEAQRQSRKQEKRITRSFQEIKETAHQAMNSGAMWFQKSDVITTNFRIEAKTKVKKSKSITLQKEWFDKIEMEAFETSKTGLVAFSFGGGVDYIGLKMSDFIIIVEELNRLKGEIKNEKD